MSKSSSVIGSACSGMKSRSFHTNWDDVSPVSSQRIDKVSQIVGCYKHIHHQEQLAKKLKGARILMDLTKY